MKYGMNFLIIIFRILFFGILAACTNYFLDTGSPYWVACLGAALGVGSSFVLASSSATLLTFFLSCATLFGLEKGLFYIIELFGPALSSQIFLPYQIEQHFIILLLNFYATAFLTWFFCRIEGFATLEVVGFLASIVFLLSGHRNFHFDSPKIFNSLAWTLGVSPLTIFILAGLGATFSSILYSYGSIQYIPTNTPTSPHISIGRIRIFKTGFIALVFLAILYGICSYLYSSFNAIQLVRTTNGVGQERSPGISPLGFHSALGSTNQPAALVRLDGDYQQNPFSPMLYLRENALSQFNGKEIVMADRIFDRDVSASAPDEHFVGDEDITLTNRTKVSLSAFLLANHNTTFAIDYPISISPIKNPNPQRFKGAFKAISLVPQFKLDDLMFEQVGDSRWNDQTWKHYLETNQDPRYRELAEKLALGQMTNVQKAASVVQYLSENAIYTLTPNHSVPAGGDQVAPFLFGDMRGYCVHFSHATVYMLRALGIPARIGTGYLTDLSQAKDGHILLRMSDRHAWAEIYLEGRGWIPFDTKPQHVESHADSKIDMKLLEELMGMIGPDELILPKDIAKEEPGAQETPPEFDFQPPNLAPYMLGVLFMLFLAKFWIRFGWVLPADSTTKLHRAYRSSVSYCHDLGLLRMTGETKQEYQNRIAHELGTPLLLLTQLILTEQYGLPADSQDLLSEIQGVVQLERIKRRSLPFGKKLLAFLNPMSVFTLLRQRW